MAGGRPKSSYSQGLRLLQIRERLALRGQVTIPELMREFGVNRRTVQRDLSVLGEVTALETGGRTPRGEKTFRLPATARADTLELTGLEMLCLCLGRHLLAFGGTVVEQALAGIFDRLHARLDLAGSRKLGQKLLSTCQTPALARGCEHVLAPLVTGLLEERKVRVASDRHEDVIHPYTLAAHDCALYVVCLSERERARRVLSIDRLTDAEWLREERFTYPDDLDPQRELERAFSNELGDLSEARLLLSSRSAQLLRQRDASTISRRIERASGKVEITLRTRVGDELVRWLTGLGPEVSVLAPKSLRDRVREHHERALGLGRRRRA